MSKEIFLVDANTFITPYKTYYSFDISPPFWLFLKEHITSTSGDPKIPDVASVFQVKCVSLYDMMRSLKFTF